MLKSIHSRGRGTETRAQTCTLAIDCLRGLLEISVRYFRFFFLFFFFFGWLAGPCVCVSRERITRHPLRTCSAGCRGVPCAIAHRFLPSSIYYHHSAGLSGRSHPLYTARSICRRCGIVFLYIPFWVSFIFTLTGLTTDDETG